MILRKMLKFFIAVDPSVEYDANAVLLKIDNYSSDKNKDIILDMSKIINRISTKLN